MRKLIKKAVHQVTRRSIESSRIALIERYVLVTTRILNEVVKAKRKTSEKRQSKKRKKHTPMFELGEDMESDSGEELA